jgi:hypothetical protein
MPDVRALLAALALVALMLALQAPIALGQGIKPNPKATVGASTSFRALQMVYGGSKSFKNAYRLRRAGACMNKRGSLCSSGLGDDEQAQLLMATSPQRYDAREPSQTGGFSAVGKVKAQVRA